MSDSAEVTNGSDIAEQRGPPLTFSFKSSKGKYSDAKKERVESEIDESDRQLLSGIGPNGLRSADGRSAAIPKVIKKLENTWHPEKRMKHGFLPEGPEGGKNENIEEKFEIERVEAGPESSVQYGLTLRVKAEATEDVDDRLRNGVSSYETDNKRFKEDMAELPDEAALDAYEAMPIEDFGRAMLTGMGWEKGKPIGKNNKGLVEPVEYVPRQGRLGLGAQPKPMEREQKFIKPGDKRGAKPVMEAAVGPDGRVKHVKSISEKLVERVQPGVQVGKTMVLIAGRHQGLRAKVLKIETKEEGRSQRASVKIMPSEHVTAVRMSELADIGSLEEEEADKRKEGGREDRRQVSERGGRVAERRVGGEEEDGAGRGMEDRRRRDGEERRGEGRESDRRRQGEKGVEENEREGQKMDVDSRERSNERHERIGNGENGNGGPHGNGESVNGRSGKGSGGREVGGGGGGRLGEGGRGWLMGHIKVKIIDKDLGGGRLYLKKATVVEVRTHTTCDLVVEESEELVQEVGEEMLETYVPRRGGRVVVLGGDNRGEVGKLIEKDRERSEAVLQLGESFEMVRVGLDLVAEFVGEMRDFEG